MGSRSLFEPKASFERIHSAFSACRRSFAYRQSYAYTGGIFVQAKDPERQRAYQLMFAIVDIILHYMRSVNELALEYSQNCAKHFQK